MRRGSWLFLLSGLVACSTAEVQSVSPHSSPEAKNSSVNEVAELASPTPSSKSVATHEKSLTKVTPTEATAPKSALTEAASSHVEALQARVHPIDEVIPEGRESPYSNRLIQLLRKWPMRDIPKTLPTENPIWMKMVRTPGKATYIGCEKLMMIKAPLKNVIALMEAYEAYPEMYDGLKTVRIVERDGNKILTFWERYSPAFFVPNIKYEQVYLIEHPSEQRAIYRYQLKSSKSVNFADGFVVLDAVGNSTRLTSIDFFDANWGLLGALALGRIWRESVENDYRGSIAFKSKAEHPEWNLEELKKESERVLTQFPVEPIQYAEQLDPDSP